MMVIIRSSAIAREVEPCGKCKIAAAPDNGRSNEPWQWRLTIGDHPSNQPALNGQDLRVRDPGSGEERILELAYEQNLVSATMRTEVFDSQRELSRNAGELVVVYLSSGELAFDHHTLGAGDAAIVSGAEHYQVTTKPLTDEAGVALIRLGSVTGTGLVWVP